MYKKLFLSATLSALFAGTPVMAEDLNQPQDHHSTINQQQNNQVGQPIDNRIDSEVREHQSNTPPNPPETQPLPATPPSRSVITPETPPPPTRINPQIPQTTDPTVPSTQSPPGNAPVVPDSAYPDATYPDDTATPSR